MAQFRAIGRERAFVKKPQEQRLPEEMRMESRLRWYRAAGALEANRKRC